MTPAGYRKVFVAVVFAIVLFWSDASYAKYIFRYEPLVTSEWAKTPGNEKKLPYEECWIDVPLTQDCSYFVGTTLSPDWRVSRGVTGNNFYSALSCVSPSLNLAFQIPIHLTPITYRGLDLSGPSGHFRLKFSFSKKSLNEKTVSQVMGEYSGVEVGLGIGAVGGVYGSATNASLVKFKATAIRPAMLFQMGRMNTFIRVIGPPNPNSMSVPDMDSESCCDADMKHLKVYEELFVSHEGIEDLKSFRFVRIPE